MLIQYGLGITEMRGSAGGITIARNRAGAYARARTKPVNPRSSRQVARRVTFMYLAEQWRESPMTDQFRANWAQYADTVNWNNKLGQDITLTGFQHFMRTNAINILNSKALNYDAPVAVGLPGGDPAMTVALSEANGLTVTYNDQLPWVSEDGAYLVMDVGKPVGLGINFFAGPWRYNGSLGGNNGAPPASPQGPWAISSWNVVEGTKCAVRAKIIRTDGRMSTPFGGVLVTVGA